MARMLCSKPCWAKAVSLSKVIDLRSAGFMRAKIASMTEMVSAAVFPASRADESPQRRIFLEYGFTPPAQLIGSGGVKRRITPAGQGVASQFPRYGGFRSLKRPGDGADRAAGRPHDGDLVSFLVQQM